MSEAVYIGWWVVGLSGSELRRFGGDPAEVITKSWSQRSTGWAN